MSCVCCANSGHDTTLTVPTVDAIAEAYPGVPIDTVSLRHSRCSSLSGIYLVAHVEELSILFCPLVPALFVSPPRERVMWLQEYFESHGPLATALSIDKAREMLGWEPEEDWRQGAAGFRQPEPEPEGGWAGDGGYVPSWHTRPKL